MFRSIHIQDWGLLTAALSTAIFIFIKLLPGFKETMRPENESIIIIEADDESEQEVRQAHKKLYQKLQKAQTDLNELQQAIIDTESLERKKQRFQGNLAQ